MSSSSSSLSSVSLSFLGTNCNNMLWLKLIFVILICSKVNVIDGCKTNPTTNQFESVHSKSSIDQSSQQKQFKLFSQFLLQKYHWQMSLDDVGVLYDAFTEFQSLHHDKVPLKSRDTKISNLPSCFKLQQKPQNSNNLKAAPSLLSMKKLVKNRKDTPVIMSVSSYSGRKKKPKHNRIFSKYEAIKALNESSHFQTCALLGKHASTTFCVASFFKNHHRPLRETADILTFYPPSVMLKRCSQVQCHCINRHHTCLPTGTTFKEFYTVGADRKQRTWTWAFYFTEHTGCKCQDRCHNRRCIAPFELHTDSMTSDCSCKCRRGYESECEAVVRGNKKFSISDYNCIMTGKCLKPDCYYGELSEEATYNRRCPFIDPQSSSSSSWSSASTLYT